MRFVVSFHTGSPDKTYNLQPPALWSAGELAAAILAGCMPATAAFCNHLSPKMSLYLRPGNSPPSLNPNNPSPNQKNNNKKNKFRIHNPNNNNTLEPPLPAAQRSSWRAPRTWNESYLLRSGSHVGSELERGESGEGIRKQMSHSSDEGAREMVEEHLEWSVWRR